MTEHTNIVYRIIYLVDKCTVILLIILYKREKKIKYFRIIITLIHVDISICRSNFDTMTL